MKFLKNLSASKLRARTVILCWLTACLLAQAITFNASAYTEGNRANSEDCPELDSSVAAQLGDPFPSLVKGIEEYLEQGKPVTELHAVFKKESPPDQASPEDSRTDYRVKAWVVDLEGKGNKDVAVTIHVGFLYRIPAVFVFRRCSSGKYSTRFINPDPQIQQPVADTGDVTIIPARLRGDNSTQLFIRYYAVMSGRCIAERILVVGLEDDVWKNYLDDRVGCGRRDLTVVRRVIALDPDATGQRNLMLTGDQWTGWGSLLFAQQRVRVFYTWDGDQLRFNKRVYLPSAYRFHILRDAELALEIGNLDLAKQNYEKAAYEVALENSLSLYEFESIEFIMSDNKGYREAQKIAGQYQMAFARFRLLVLSASIEQSKRLESMVKQMAGAYPAGKPGSEFSELSLVFQEEFLKSGDKQKACAKVSVLVEGQFPNLVGANGHVGNWGDPGQGEFTVKTACPQFIKP